MSDEWHQIALNFQGSVWKDPCKFLSNMIYMFGKERVVILSQTYHVFTATVLIVLPCLERVEQFRASLHIRVW